MLSIFGLAIQHSHGFNAIGPALPQAWSRRHSGDAESEGRDRLVVFVTVGQPCWLFPMRWPYRFSARCLFSPFSPKAESFGVSAQIGSGVVRGGPEVRFHEGSTRVPPGFHQGSTRVPKGFCEGCGVVRALKRAPHAVGDIT